MANNIKELVEKSKLAENDKYYWGYQYDLGNTVITPYLKSKNAFKAGDVVAEIGSAEGGVVHSLVYHGAKYALGTDIAKSRIESGKIISEITGLNVEFKYHNVVDEKSPKEWLNKFDLVILRDVIEHLDSAETALKNIMEIIKPGGFLYVEFPPYYAPYGGHQHTVAGNLISKLPYIHFIPQKYSLETCVKRKTSRYYRSWQIERHQINHRKIS